ncbi:MAG: ABC transporter transmembrane domain-containing protein [candidate division WOR-3 bacterium]
MINGVNPSFFEEDKTGKIYDSTIMKWLMRYVRPYRKIVFMNIFLLLLITGMNLALPFIYKIGIDRYVSPTGKEVLQAEKVPSEFRNKIIESSDNRRFVSLVSVKESVKGKMEDEGIISRDDFYFIKKTERALPIIAKTEYIEADGFYLLASKEMAKLSIEERIHLRTGDLKGIEQLAFIYLILIISIFIFSYIQVYQIQNIGQRISYNIREDIVKKFTTLAYRFFQKNPLGRLVTRVSGISYSDHPGNIGYNAVFEPSSFSGDTCCYSSARFYNLCFQVEGERCL